MCIANSLGRVVLGYRVFGNGSGKSDLRADEFRSMVLEVLVLTGVFNIGDFVPALDWLDLQGVAAKMKKIHKRFDAFLTTIVEEHTAKVEDGQHNDLLRHVHSCIDTSSSTVEWAIAELIRHPEMMPQVQEELDLVVGPDMTPCNEPIH
ncbi:hypothetical protein TIFTF001_023404 [Ficus carica]|uniref:Uncharacterized protein n=1 Tax=Ficus carica TaxID=3494 RepID=A0AA88AWT2_FICCA|nr:hypothetical protein TIFTF001_023404 [Ficus carica]